MWMLPDLLHMDSLRIWFIDNTTISFLLSVEVATVWIIGGTNCRRLFIDDYLVIYRIFFKRMLTIRLANPVVYTIYINVTYLFHNVCFFNDGITDDAVMGFGTNTSVASNLTTDSCTGSDAAASRCAGISTAGCTTCKTEFRSLLTANFFAHHSAINLASSIPRYF